MAVFLLPKETKSPLTSVLLTSTSWKEVIHILNGPRKVKTSLKRSPEIMVWKGDVQ